MTGRPKQVWIYCSLLAVVSGYSISAFLPPASWTHVFLFSEHTGWILQLRTWISVLSTSALIIPAALLFFRVRWCVYVAGFLALSITVNDVGYPLYLNDPYAGLLILAAPYYLFLWWVTGYMWRLRYQDYYSVRGRMT